MKSTEHRRRASSVGRRLLSARLVQKGSEGGFSLLEVMVSVAILAMALVVLSRVVTGNVRATHHSRMITAATFLARSKIASMEQSILEYGFGEMDGEEDGDFTDEGFPHFRWYAAIERIELPTDITQKAQQESQELSQSSSPMEMLTGFMGGFMSTLLEPIRIGLEESVRRLTVRVNWDEVGRTDQSFEVVAFLTDPSKLDLALTGGTSTGQTGTATGVGTGTGARTSNTRAAGTRGMGSAARELIR